MIVEKIAHIWIEQDVVFLAPIQRKNIGIFACNNARQQDMAVVFKRNEPLIKETVISRA